MRLTVGFMVASLAAMAAGPSAEKFAKEAEKAEKGGETVRAYLLYAQAALADRKNTAYWAKAESLRPMAEVQATEKLPTPELKSPSDQFIPPTGVDLVRTFTAQDLEDLERMKPPPRLRPSTLTKTFHLHGEAKPLFEQVAKEFGYIVIFDRDYNPPVANIRFNVSDVGYREALHALEDATNSFIVPISDGAMLVSQDTQQKRTELENDEVQAIPIPQRTSIQEAQELLVLVQQSLDIRRAALDPQRHMILLRDRVSKVETAAAILNQLAIGKPQVSIDVDFISTGVTSSLSLGLSLPTSFPLVNFGSVLHSVPSIPAGFMRFLTFGAGRTFFGIGITDAQLFATATRSSATTLLKSTVMASDGQPANLHVGDKYPIVTSGYLGFGNVPGGGSGGTPSGTTYAEISTTPYADLFTAPVSATGRMKLVVNGVTIPLVLSSATDNLAAFESIINSLQAGVYASVVQRGTQNRPLTLVISATSFGVTSVQLIDDPDGAAVELLKLPTAVSGVTNELSDATQAKASQNGSLNLTVGANAFPLTLTSDKNNLNGLRDAINAANAAVTAAVVPSSLVTGAVFLQVVANNVDSGAIQLYDDPSGANTALLIPTDQVNQAGSQFGQPLQSTSTGNNGIGNIGQIYTPPPTFTFEDLGLVLKITPFVHSLEEVTLEIEAEFKVLGSGSFNGVPVISARKFQGKVRLNTSESAVVAGLVSDSQSRTITGIAGLMNVPGIGALLRDNEKTHEQQNLLIVIKPTVTSLPASEFVTRTLWVGSETRPRSPL